MNEHDPAAGQDYFEEDVPLEDIQSVEVEVEYTRDGDRVDALRSETVIEEVRQGSHVGVRGCKAYEGTLVRLVLDRFVADKTKVIGKVPIRSGYTSYHADHRKRPSRRGGADKCWVTVTVNCFAVFA